MSIFLFSLIKRVYSSGENKVKSFTEVLSRLNRKCFLVNIFMHIIYEVKQNIFGKIFSAIPYDSLGSLYAFLKVIICSSATYSTCMSVQRKLTSFKEISS